MGPTKKRGRPRAAERRADSVKLTVRLPRQLARLLRTYAAHHDVELG